MAGFFKTDITAIGGTIDNTLIGNTTPSSGVFTTLASTTSVDLDATGTNTITLDSVSGLISLDSTSGAITVGTGTTGAISMGSSSAGIMTIASGGNIGIDSVATLSLDGSTLSVTADGSGGVTINSTEGTALTTIGSDGSAGVLVDAGHASGSVDVVASGGGDINIGTDAATTSVNIGTGTAIGSSGITIGRGGITTTIAGDLDISGTLNTANEVNLAVENNHILLNAGYDAETPVGGCIVINSDPDVAGTQTNIATGAFTSTTTVNVVDASTFLVGDIIIITGTNNAENDSYYAIASIDTAATPDEITIKTSTNIQTPSTSFVVDSTVAGRVTRTTISSLVGTTNGDWQIGIDDNDDTFSFNVLAIVAPPTEALVFSTGSSNDLSATLGVSHFTLLHSSGTISGTLPIQSVDGFKKTIVCNSFPNSGGTTYYDLTVSPFQDGTGSMLTDRIFRFISAGQSASIVWNTVPKTVNVQTVAVASLSDDEYFDVNSAADAAAYRFWFDVSGLAAGPAAGGRTLVMIDVSGDTTAADVATTTAGVVDGTNGGADFEAVVTGGTIVAIIVTAYGATTDATEAVADAGFTVENHDGAWFNANVGVVLV